MEKVFTTSKSSFSSAYIREFNSHFQNSIQTSTVVSNGKCHDESLLNRSLSLLSSSQSLEDFNPHQLENVQFFINLHDILNNMDKDSDILWQSISILQLAIRNLETREALLYKFRYFPVLAKILLKLTAEEKTQRLLTLMHDISYGIQIKWEEPYLEELLNFLLKYCMEDDEETTLGSLSLSVLINLSYKNFPVICLLIKTVNISVLSKKIKKYNILANKLLVILAKDISSPGFIDSSLFIKKSFIDCCRATQTWNVPYLKHIFEFLKDSKDNPYLQNALNTYTEYEQDIQDLIVNIENRLEMDDSSQENQKIIQTCFSLIFEFLNYILEGVMALGSKQKNQCLQLSSKLLLKIYEFTEKWFECQLSGAAALKLFETIIKLADDTLLTKLSKKLKALHQLIEIAETSHNLNLEYVAALHKLILVLLQNSKTQKFVISSITESYFDKIFQPIFNISLESELHSMTISSGDLSKYLSCLNILIEFAKIAENVWSQKCKLFLEMHQIQFLLARGILSKDQNLCSLVIDLAKNFSFELLSKYVCQLTISNSGRKEIKPEKYLEINADRDNIISVSRSCEDQLQALLDKISKTKFEHIAVSEIIELYNYQLDLLKKNKSNYAKKIDVANEEITQLSQENCLMIAELKKYQNMSFRSNFIQERLENEIRDMTKQCNVHKNSLNKMGRKIKDKDKQFKQLQNILDTQTAELTTLRDDLSHAKLREEKYINEIFNLKNAQQENITRIDQMKKTISLAEKEQKETIQKLDEKDRELTRLSKLSEETETELTKAQKIIEHLEQQITEKNLKIKHFEDEIQESEETRKMIMSLMESKKPKRKA